MTDILKNGVRLHKSNLNAIGQRILPMLDSGETCRLIIKPWREKRSLNQNALSRLWDSKLSDWLIGTAKTLPLLNGLKTR